MKIDDLRMINVKVGNISSYNLEKSIPEVIKDLQQFVDKYGQLFL